MRAAMRCWPLVVVALGAGGASAQPAPDADKPAEPAPPVEPPVEPKPAEPQPKPVITPSEPAKPEAPSDRRVGAPPCEDCGFRFGSYGRVIAGTDLRGGKPEKILVVAHGPRIVEPSYLELELSYGFERLRSADREIVLRPIITLAFDDTLFHDTGNFDAHPAIRNLFLDARLASGITAWVGSRMYRGDDIYLFDFWPLDNQNTVGGGAAWHGAVATHGEPGAPAHDTVDVAIHGGVNRLDNPFQFQQIQVPNPAQGATTVVQLNRQRLIASTTATYTVEPRHDGGFGGKLRIHGQYHALASGSFKRDDGTLEALPADSGYLLGAEVGAYRKPRDGHRGFLNLFTRYARGLAAFDELAPPTSFGADLKTTNASELSFGASGAWDTPWGNVMIGALSRRFLDATGQAVDPNNGWEYAIDARPLARVAPDWFVGGDVSYQARFPNGLNPNTLRAEDAAVFELAPMAVFSPMGPSAYDRPQLRFVYRAAHLNDGALDQYVPDDPRHGHAWVHFLGVQAEWWFNSSTYR